MWYEVTGNVIVGILSICLKTTLWKPNLIKHLTAQNSVNGDPFFKKFWWIAVHTPSFKMEHWEWLGMTFGHNTFTHCPLTHPSILQVIFFDQKSRIYTIIEEDLRGKQGDGRRGFELWVMGEECEEGGLLGRWWWVTKVVTSRIKLNHPHHQRLTKYLASKIVRQPFHPRMTIWF